MLDADKRAKLLREAMDEAIPPVTGKVLAKACDVKPQAVSGWRKTGRYDRRHIPVIADLTGKPYDYFLGIDAPQHVKERKVLARGRENVDANGFQNVKRAWQYADKNGRQALLTVANTLLELHSAKSRQQAR